MDRELDACLGSCVLRDIRAAKPVVDELTAFHDRVDVLTFVVMPNHVHVVASFHGEDLAKWVGTVKGRTGRAINRAMGTTGSLWQPEYFDRMVRDETHLEATCRYVEWNPVRSGLCVDPRDYPYSSANEHVRARLREADRNRG